MDEESIFFFTVIHLTENSYYDGIFQFGDNGMEVLILAREMRYD